MKLPPKIKLVFLLLFSCAMGVCGEDETLTISSTSFGTSDQYVSNASGDFYLLTGSDPATEIHIKYVNMCYATNVFKLQKEHGGFNTTTCPKGKVIKSISINSNSRFNYQIGKGEETKQWTSVETIYNPTTKNYTLDDGYQYVKITATPSIDAEIASITITYRDINPLSTPQNCVVSSISATKAILSWDAVPNASSYEVRIGSKSYVTNTNSYTITGLTPITEYTWSVRAIGDKENNTDGEFCTDQHFTTIANGCTSVIDFEQELDTYSDWSFSNIKIETSNNTFEGKGYGANENADAWIKTIKKIHTPKYLKCYISKTTDNTSKSTWKIEVSSDNNNWSKVFEKDAISMSRYEWLPFEADLSSYKDVFVRVSYGTSSAVRAIDKLTLIYDEYLALSAQNKDGYWSTFSSDKAVEFTDANTTVYTVNVDGGKLLMTEVANKQVPANTGVLIKSSSETVSYYYIASATALENNLLKPGANVMTEGENCRFYRLAYNDFSSKSGLGFYYGQDCNDGQAFKCKAGLAYLAVPEQSSVKCYLLDEIDEDAIGNVLPSQAGEAVIYNLAGQRVKKMQRGINIVNGKVYVHNN